jgi:lantibiotic transport system permease protein
MPLSLFVRVVTVECLKLKRTLALGMVVLAPVTVVILHGLILYAGGERVVRGGRDAWSQLCTNSVGMWTLLMMPMFVTLETSLLAGLEHNGNWKAVLTLPAPRWAVYIAKLLVAVGLLWLQGAAAQRRLHDDGLRRWRCSRRCSTSSRPRRSAS